MNKKSFRKCCWEYFNWAVKFQCIVSASAQCALRREHLGTAKGSQRTIAVLRAPWNSDVNFIDTADSYGRTQTKN